MEGTVHLELLVRGSQYSGVLFHPLSGNRPSYIFPENAR
jgi:hypothetical protein